jgi:hypothetical protein
MKNNRVSAPILGAGLFAFALAGPALAATPDSAKVGAILTKLLFGVVAIVFGVVRLRSALEKKRAANTSAGKPATEFVRFLMIGSAAVVFLMLASIVSTALLGPEQALSSPFLWAWVALLMGAWIGLIAVRARRLRGAQ